MPSVRESRDRIRSAIRNSGFEFPLHRITVNLAPADVRKAGSSFDLPIAIGILAATGDVRRRDVDDVLVLGELSLDGGIQAARGVLPIAAAARRRRFRGLLLPAANTSEAAVVSGLDFYPVQSLTEAVEALNDPKPDPSSSRGARRPLASRTGGLCRRARPDRWPAGARDRRCWWSQRAARRPTGIGQDDDGEARGGHSAAADVRRGARRHRHSLRCRVARSGNGAAALTALSRAAPHGFGCRARRRRLEPAPRRDQPGAPRGPVSRRDAGIQSPGARSSPPAARRRARPNRAGAANRSLPCPLRADWRHESVPVRLSRRSAATVPMFAWSGGSLCRSALGTASGPAGPHGRCRGAAARGIDVHDRGRIKRRDSCTRVEAARCRQRQRAGDSDASLNARLAPRQIRRVCALDEGGQRLLRQAADKLGLTARAFDRVLRVARTIADLDGADRVATEHLAEALHFRGA